jgi:hypothetical protein
VRNRAVRQVVQLLEVGVAQHQTVLRIPQHEGFRDGLDRVAQANVGRHRLLHQLLLLGHIDGDADEVQARLIGVARDLAARPQPHPLAVRMAHAEIMIDRLGLTVGELGRNLVELDVVRMDERVDLAERQQFVARVEPENREHRMRPEDAAAREIPVPQAAAAAVERGVDAPAHHVVDHVGFARARRLPVKCESRGSAPRSRSWRRA